MKNLNTLHIINFIFITTIILDLFINDFNLSRAALNFAMFFLAFIIGKCNLKNASEWWSHPIDKFFYCITIVFSVLATIVSFIQYVITYITSNHDYNSFSIIIFFTFLGTLKACIKEPVGDVPFLVSFSQLKLK